MPSNTDLKLNDFGTAVLATTPKWRDVSQLVYTPITTAIPTQEVMIRARAIVSASAEVKDLFSKAWNAKWDAPLLASKLTEVLSMYLNQDSAEDVQQVAQFLADEFIQRDPESILLVSPTTGLPIAQIPPEAIVQPPPQDRENGAIVSALPIVHPELMAALTLHLHQQDLEAEALPILREKARSTPLQRIQGDPKLLVITSQGRKHLGQRLQIDLADPLTGGTGYSAAFASACTRTGDPSQYGDAFVVEVYGHKAIQLYDLRTVNLQFDHYANLRDTLQDRWLRDLAKQVVWSIGQRGLDEYGVLPPGFVIAPPPVALPLLRSGTFALPLEASPSVVVLQTPPWVEIQSLQVESRTNERTWEAYIRAEVSIRLPLTGVYAYSTPEIFDPGQVVEVVGS